MTAVKRIRHLSAADYMKGNEMGCDTWNNGAGWELECLLKSAKADLELAIRIIKNVKKAHKAEQALKEAKNGRKNNQRSNGK